MGRRVGEYGLAGYWRNGGLNDINYKKMEKDFVTLEQFRELFELGYDVPPVSTYTQKPLKQQVFRWFRVKYKLEPEILSDMFGYVCSIVDRNKPVKIQLSPKNLFQTYEEAEHALIDKLIELVKQQ